MKIIFILIILAFSLNINAQESKLSKTDEVLSKALEKGIALAEKTGTFVIEQAPELLKEFYAWKLYSNIGLAILMVIIMIVIFLITRKIAISDDDDTVYIFNLFQLLPFAFLVISIYEIIFISVAPKLYLINYFIK